MTGHVFSLLDGEISVEPTLSDDSELCCKLQYIYSQTVVGKIMATEKTTTLTFRIEPNLKEALCTAADRDHLKAQLLVAIRAVGGTCSKTDAPMLLARALGLGLCAHGAWYHHHGRSDFAQPGARGSC